MALRAITREVSAGIVRCRLTYRERQPLDVTAARRELAAYEALLRELGCTVTRLAAGPELPDSVFVEDTAVVLPELAVIARPGAEPRRAETEAVAAALRPHRALRRIRAPATLDGGDVLVVGKRVFVGRSTRTNEAGCSQLAALLSELGYEVRAVGVGDCLHLKSAVTAVAPETVLIRPALVDAAALAGLRRIEADPAEPAAANALWVGESVIVAAAHPRTARRLAEAGLRCRQLELAELAKAEGGPTCCSLVFET